MRSKFWFLLAVLAWVTPAAAADRTLLAPYGAASTLSTSPAASAMLQSLHQSAAARGHVKVIVGLRVPFAAEATLAAGMRDAQRHDIAVASGALRTRFAAAAARHRGAVQSFDAMPFMAMDVTGQELSALAADPLVLSLSPDFKLRRSLAESAPLIHAPEAWAAGYTGQGQTVAILDTGVDSTHPFLAGKVVSEACYSKGGYCPQGATSSTAAGSGLPCPRAEPWAHGTHVAGIAAGRGDSASGIARDAAIIAIQVFSPDPSDATDITAWYSDVLAGLNRVYQLRNSYPIAAVNLSLGGGRYSGTCDGAYPAMTAAIANLKSAGIATVVAAGNDYYSDSASFPACISGAVSVGAVSDSDWGPCFDGTPTAADRIACYSNDDPFVSLLAPGSAITSSVPGGGYETWHGTSMAAPHITGAWAILKQRMPNATVSDVLAAFQKTGTPVTDTRGTRPYTRPRADVAAALTQFVTLSYTADRDGGGTVSFKTARGITTCNASCAITLVTGTAVSVTVRPASGSALLGWSGACSGRGLCSFTVTEATSLAASFGPASTYDLSYDRAGTGTGTVLFRTAGGAQSCADGCTQSYNQGTLVMLTAMPGRRSRFMGWSGDCGRRRICILNMSAAKSVTARFGGR